MKTNNSTAPDAKKNPLDFAMLLNEELIEIRKLRDKRQWRHGDVANSRHSNVVVPCGEARPQTNSTQPEPLISQRVTGDGSDSVFQAAHQEELVGLAFSGGGIRSATFNLGVLQGLADLGLIPMFDYLSTVSGGGYVGSWLEAWIYRASNDPRVARCHTTSNVGASLSPIRQVQECLKPDRSTKPEHSEPKAIRFLREYSNYLTPRLGFLGADTWTAVAVYLRNLFLNQSILILFLFFLLLLPHLLISFSLAITSLQCFGARIVPPIVVFALVLFAQWVVSTNMNHLTGIGPTGEFPPVARQGSILALVVAPLFAAAWLLSVWITSEKGWTWHWWAWTILGVIGFGVTWTVAVLWGFEVPDHTVAKWNSTSVRLMSVGLSLISGSFAGLLLWVFANKILEKWSLVDGSIWHIVSFGTPLVVFIFLLVATVQIGLMGRLSPDPRREWWGRLAGWLLILSIVWAAAFALAIYSPLGLMWAKRWIAISGVTWLFTTGAGVLGGRSAKTSLGTSTSWKERALSVTPYVFIVGLAAVLSTLLELLLATLNGASTSDAASRFLSGSPTAQKVADWIISVNWNWSVGDGLRQQGTMTSNPAAFNHSTDYVLAHWEVLRGISNFNLIFPLMATAILCTLLAWRVDLNEFSMNLFYRNRLVRCYLGASHIFRNPNPFTGFDPSDDIYLTELRSDNCYSGPFPIINTALNLVKGQNLAWQERKAESFVITPLRCGFDTWAERSDLEAESVQMKQTTIQKYGFRPTDDFGYPRGIRLGVQCRYPALLPVQTWATIRRRLLHF